jgi:DNA-binding LacI/PurR family transcriptional regulator
VTTDPKTGGILPRTPVMHDVAALAGVSHQTVSRVVNGHPSVAPDTRERVERAIAELGYRPNTAARALVTRSTRTIGLVTVNVNQYGPAQTMLGLEGAARQAGYSLSVAMLDEPSAVAMRDAVDRFVAQSVDAVLVQATYDAAAEALRSLNPPVPIVAVQVGGDHHHPTVYNDQQHGAGLATRHLLDLGHLTVHHVAGPVDSQEAQGRVVGWRDALLAAGALVPEPLVGDWQPESGYAAGVELARRIKNRARSSGSDAVFVANDQMALGLLHALREAGLDVPGDVSVVGFDDLPEAGFFAPPLTTVRQDFAELGRVGVQTVHDLLHGRPVSPAPARTRLVVRESTAPPAG